MPSWLLVVIVSSVELVILVAIIGALVIVASTRNHKLRNELVKTRKELYHDRQLLDAYGIKEIQIGGNEE